VSRLRTHTIPGTTLDQRCERAAVVIFRVRKRRVEFLLVSRNSNPDQFVLPGGRVEVGESPPVTAMRECMEESGANVRLLGPLVRYDHYTTRGVARPTMAYLASAHSVTRSPEGRDVIWARHTDLIEGVYDVPYAVLDVLDYAAQCLAIDHAAA
jgi:8-oxo-dGTP pyrophosphatase MutT (NUDIX family)